MSSFKILLEYVSGRVKDESLVISHQFLPSGSPVQGAVSICNIHVKNRALFLPLMIPRNKNWAL